jgi:hypothetical protein
VPIETQEFIKAKGRSITIDWQCASLVEIIQRRIQVASGGAYDTLNDITTPPSYGVETWLVQQTKPPLPRELLVLTQRVFIEHLRRSDTGEIEKQDIESAIDWYLNNKRIGEVVS